MEKDSVRNQKVFVTLESVLMIQTKLISGGERAKGKLERDYPKGYLDGILWVAKTLNLPI